MLREVTQYLITNAAILTLKSDELRVIGI